MLQEVNSAIARQSERDRRGGVRLAGFAAGLVANLGWIQPTSATRYLIPFASVLVLLVSMSIYLSRAFARTNHELRTQLDQVRMLSEQKLAQERRARKQEIERQLLEAAYEHKAAELEEARQLQLSMLPDRLPELPWLQVAAYMETATEVGGDYYDFAVEENGSLTVAIGDATGHGMRAGTMVIATKSLFNALGSDSDLRRTLMRSTSALKRMRLRKLAIALTLARFEPGRLRLAAAGMPPAYIYRASTGELESVLLGGMPLGSLVGFPYQETSIPLQVGDTVVLMSDGFPERLNTSAEMIGYERTEALIRSAGTDTPKVIIERLVSEARQWGGEQELDDDMTFVVIQMRNRLPAQG